ncbi:hemolysin secretion protein D [Novosphingobium endophyticum]|uniref:Hemolysin secretion protein D n=1 Tax=Novosphingobium endophyticum TaxID=1955250 RepID=A0A916X5I9_9SPHN|nr:efflux RND transporter periplasmic adaptor subunit [Novosphingobium endophyticum]GGC00990.1 hemolysin secretion protein D [Novosphingobium endophyticum]
MPIRKSSLRAAVLMLGALVPLSACSSGEQGKEARTPPQAVTVAVVAERQISGGITASGRLLPREEMAVAADLSGFRVARVLVEEGAFAKAGQPLAILDDSLLRSQISQMEAQLAQQQVSAEQARDQAVRVEGLENQGVLSNEAIAQRRFAARTSAASVAATRAQLDDLLVRRSHLVIRAPASGKVIERVVRPGDTSSAGTVMFRMARGNLIELYAELPEADAARVRMGDPARVTLSSGHTLEGHVRLIGERIDQTTGVVIARVALPVDSELRSGGFAKARFSGDKSVLALPEKAVHYDADGASVMVIDKDNRVRRVRVSTGDHADGHVELRQGPPAGSRVAVKGAAFTLEGDVVKVVGGTER